VQPRPGEELVVERMLASEEGSFLPSSLAADGDDSPQIVLSVDALRARLREIPKDADVRPLLIFDQFEELVTLFEEALEGAALAQGRVCQQQIVDLIVEVLRDETLPVKLLFAFREDYLAKVKRLLALCPELVDQSLHLAPPGTDALYEIIRGPFERHPGRFDRELSPELAEDLSAAIASRTASGAPDLKAGGTVNLTEVQIVCLRLWQSDDPEALLAERGVQGLLEDYLEQSLQSFREELHYPAVALLSQMVTGSGVRNVISDDDLIDRVRAEEPEIPRERLVDALDELERGTKLVRRERRRELDLYEISSEFLVPWIGRQREERLRARERAELERLKAEEQAELERRLEEKRRQQRTTLVTRLGLVISVLFLAAVALGLLALFSFLSARTERDQSQSRELAQNAVARLDSGDLSAARNLAGDAFRKNETTEAEEALRSALVASLPSRRSRPLLQESQVNTAGFSPDGRLLVVGSEDLFAARFVDTSTGDEVGRRLRHHGPVKSAAFSPDGRRVVTASGDGTAQVWNAETRKPIGPPLRHRGQVNSAAFSPDGDLVVTASDDRTARLWNATTGAPVGQPLQHTAAVTSAAFSPDGRRVITGTFDGKATIWNRDTGRAETVLRGHEGAVWSVAFSPASPRGDVVATAGDDGAAIVWRVSARRPLSIVRSDAPLKSVAFSPGGRLLVAAGLDQVARVWTAQTGERITVLQGHLEPINSATFSRDGARIATAGLDGVRIWDTGTVHSSSPLSTASSSGADFDPDGKLVVAAGPGGVTRFWQVAGRRPAGGPIRHGAAVESVAFSPDGKLVLTAGADGTVQLWGTECRCKVGNPLRHPREVTSAAFSPNGKLVVTGDVDGAARIWGSEDRALRRTLRPTGTSADPLLTPGPVTGVAFAPNGKRLVTVADERARLWDVASGRELGAAPPGDVASAAFGPGGKLLVTGSKDGTASIWDLRGLGSRAGRVVFVLALPGHTGEITRVVFSPKGNFVVTASKDGTARVWEARSGRLLSLLQGDGQPLKQAVFNPDERLVLTAGDGGVRIFSCEACRPIDELSSG
jgi:WD40 repeat protein